MLFYGIFLKKSNYKKAFGHVHEFQDKGIEEPIVGMNLFPGNESEKPIIRNIMDDLKEETWYLAEPYS